MNGDRLPIIHGERAIGDTVELIPGRAVGARGLLKEVIRTHGSDEKAQLLTVAVVGWGVHESDLKSDYASPRGPLFAAVEWGIKGARAIVEMDIPAGGVVFCVVASYLRVSARYDGLLAVNGVQLDPAARGGDDPGPKQRVGAMAGYGSYGVPTRLTRTFRLDDVPAPGDVDMPPFSARVAVPAFAKRLLVTGRGAQATAYAVRLSGFDPLVTLDDVQFAVGESPRTIDLPGDCASVVIENLGPERLVTPALTFELGL
jgi:hypothetical protein